MPSLFDTNKIGASIATLASAARSVGSLPTSNSIAGKLSGALSNLSRTGNVLSAIRSITLPAGGETGGLFKNASASFGTTDWRVQVSVPPIPAFTSSPALAPLKNAGGAIFPYTPSLRISNSANYESLKPLHQNFGFQSFVNSQADAIQITAPFYVEDAVQGAYWIAMVHFFRSMTKMFTGEDDLGGNPPPIAYFNAYGDYVFKNVPVVVTSFSVELNNDSDYISVDPSASASLTNAYGSAPASAFNTVSSLVGAVNPKAGAALAAANGIAKAVSGIAGSFRQQLAGAGSGAQGGKTYVPTKSSMTVTLQPIYSRDSARSFSLDKFVKGDYVKSGQGFI
jgi:hypothetical protein